MRQKHTILPLKLAAKVLGVRPENLQIEADAGRLPFTKIGDEYLFLLTELEAAIARRVSKNGRAVAHA